MRAYRRVRGESDELCLFLATFSRGQRRVNLRQRKPRLPFVSSRCVSRSLTDGSRPPSVLRRHRRDDTVAPRTTIAKEHDNAMHDNSRDHRTLLIIVGSRVSIRHPAKDSTLDSIVPLKHRRILASSSDGTARSAPSRRRRYQSAVPRLFISRIRELRRHASRVSPTMIGLLFPRTLRRLSSRRRTILHGEPRLLATHKRFFHRNSQ